MSQFERLNNALKKSHVSKKELAKVLGINYSTLYRKMNNFDSFLIGEVSLIRRKLNLTDEEAIKIFLDINVA